MIKVGLVGLVLISISISVKDHINDKKNVTDRVMIKEKHFSNIMYKQGGQYVGKCPLTCIQSIYFIMSIPGQGNLKSKSKS